MEIKNLKFMGKKSLVCKFDVHIPTMGMTIRDCTFFESGARHWISFPCRTYDDAEGQKKYFSYVHLEPTRKKSFEDKVIPLVQQELAKTSVQTSESSAPSFAEKPYF